jgi:hypothetical protein
MSFAPGSGPVASASSGECKPLPENEHPSEPVEILVKPQPQLDSVLCWAASTSIITSQLAPGRTDLKQCNVASLGVSKDKEYCCSDPLPAKCNRRESPPFGGVGFSVRTKGSWPTWSKLKEYLEHLQPLGLIIDYPASGGHMLVGTGWHEVEGSRDRLMQVFDPVNFGDFSWWNHEYLRDQAPDSKRRRVYYQVRECTPPKCSDDRFGLVCCLPPPESCGKDEPSEVSPESAEPPEPPEPPEHAGAELRTFASSDEAADAGLKEVCKLASEVDAKRLGFDSQDEAKNAAGRISWKRLDVVDADADALTTPKPQLREAKHPRDEYIYVLDGRYRGFITVANRGNTSYPVRYGMSTTAAHVQTEAERAYRALHRPVPQRLPVLYFQPLNLYVLKVGRPGPLERYLPVETRPADTLLKPWTKKELTDLLAKRLRPPKT